ncbi:STAS/SEC14 domain-containing protein [Bowmanella sp. Y26]|uniref:STAS/SEC14 domain-containing protein n=1 Tax=Bowmanella yangjiangensis TaxID=2811230 RepID=A0ABS3CTZ3_9ALTE|nr:STAS/SEC14 domain-containing protein [Bowmanella yangjiangensis]MBN7820596.1 STAS/SEC14 domain-containing protein [Bowmanella yangjiangensis]MBT1063800.1 STAS/SEC14 domain-containing protein [Bowmanella yangjiangensis]
MSRHGMAIGLERHDENVFMTLRVWGKLTHDDYQLLTPMLEQAVAGLTKPKINALVDARDFEGWELRAAWDDFQLGYKHGNAFNRIAVVGHNRIQALLTRLGSWFIGGEARYFEEESDALAWLLDR